MNPASLKESWKRLREGLLRDHPDIDEETLVDTLDGMTGAADLVERLIMDSEEDKALVAGLKDHIVALTRRKDRIADRGAKRKAAAMALMQELGLKKLSRPAFTASVSAGAPAARIIDDKALPPWAWRPHPPVLDTQAIRTKLLAGEDVPGAALSNGEPYMRITT